MNSKNLIKDNDLVYIYHDERRKWIRKVEKDKQFHTDRGIIRYNDLIGKEFGSTIKVTPQNNKFFLLKPIATDIVKKMGRASQIIYPEDIGLILMYTGISPGSIVLEAGCGSGSLTSIMGNYVRPNGHIYSYDIRPKAIKQALKNIEKVLPENYNVVSIELKNIIEDELPFKEEIDTVILDMATPWDAIPKIYKYLKNSGTICCFSPVIEQVKKNHAVLEEIGFFNIKTYELMKREMQVKSKGYGATRPKGRMVGHTGYLTFARKIDDPYRHETISKFEFLQKSIEEEKEKGENNKNIILDPEKFI